VVVNSLSKARKMRSIYNAPADSANRFMRQRKAKPKRGAMSRVVPAIAGLLVTTAVITACVQGTVGWAAGLDLILHWPESSSSSEQLMAETQAGTILFTSPNVDTCRQQSFDNSTGTQRDNGVVDCKTAIYQVKANQMAVRMNAVSGGFRSK
jgi:hypothetical protein